MGAKQSYVADRKVVDACRTALLVSLGRLYHSHRVAWDLSQERLADDYDTISPAAISNVENGKPDYRDHVTTLGKRLGVDPKYVAMYAALVGQSE